MKNLLFSLLVLAGILLCTQTAEAQLVSPLARVGWDQAASSLQEAQGYNYLALINNTNTVPLVTTCSGTVSPFLCTAPLPSGLNGPVTLAVRAETVIAGTVYGSAYSNTLSITVGTGPAQPQNPRIIPPQNGQLILDQ